MSCILLGGETQGYTAEQVGVDKYFIWEDFTDESGVTHHNDYKFGPIDWNDETNKGMAKYNKTDNKTELDTTDDAATANWGSNWRMPTKEQFEELTANTKTAWTQVDGVNGLLCTSTSNTNTLFFPAVGFAHDGEVVDVGDYGDYWSASLNNDNVVSAWRIYFGGVNYGMGYDYRYSGYPVRPVRSNN